MLTKSRTRPQARRPTSFVPSRSVRKRRRWPWVILAAVAVLGAAAVAVVVAWPSASIGVDDAGLPQVRTPRLSGTLEQVTLHSADGTPVPAVMARDGTLRPTRPVVAGTALVAEAVVRRPGWIGWLAGHTQTSRLLVVAPTANLGARWLRVEPGAPVRVTFDRPVRAIRVTTGHRPKLVRLPRPTRTVSLGKLGVAGSVGISAVALAWERLPPPTTVTWFPPGRAAMVLATPGHGAGLEPGTPLTLRFSAPTAAILRGRTPTLTPRVPGTWHRTDARTLEFRPRGYGYGLDSRVKLTLPAPVLVMGGARKPVKTLAWTTPTASPLRLEQMLSLLRYLPFQWTAESADAPRTAAGQISAALDPPAGRFTWRYPNVPPELARLWTPGRYSSIDRGAVMAFQNEHHLTVDGFAGHDVWQALIADVIAGKARAGGYSYVYVHSTVPQSLNLWHDGQLILTSPGNTGVPAAPTQLGTFPVFEHIPVGTMSGTNPDGSHYNDPGIQFISYFNHGEAIHAFNRASFGTPQSLGCVELPLAAAAKVWPYTPIGTLVTVEK
jgi:peptidoglycan hydrolase-like protein with peptidoglycan-binding domain